MRRTLFDRLSWLRTESRGNGRGASRGHRPTMEALEARVLMSVTFTVTNTNDTGAGSLRDAITQANSANDTAIIAFNIPSSDPNFIDTDSSTAGGDAGADVYVIAPQSALPNINNPSFSITINGATQTSFGGNTNALGPEIMLDGAGSVGTGLNITGDSNTIIGLAVGFFATAGINISGGDNNIVAGNYIGLDPNGADAAPNTAGITVTGNTNQIGGSNASDRNIISGNIVEGVRVQGGASTGNDVVNNFIGTNAAGTAAVPNGSSGVVVEDALSSRVGGLTSSNLGNVISGNLDSGVLITGAAGGTLIQGNRIGTNAAGTAAIPNSFEGVLLLDSGNTFIGGNSAGAGNVISGNGGAGVAIVGGLAVGNSVQGNIIGANAAGSSALPNVGDGVFIGEGDFLGLSTTGGATNTTVGDVTAFGRNLISGNLGAGIHLEGLTSENTVILGNFIGTNAAGTGAIGNDDAGILVVEVQNTRIGTNSAGGGNLISGNNAVGVNIQGLNNGNGTIVQNNLIGTTANGNSALGNTFQGVAIFDSPGNLIGGPGSNQGNFISANGNNGVAIAGDDSIGNVVQSNSIGLGKNGGNLGNTFSGVFIGDGTLFSPPFAGDATDTLVESNAIAFNDINGVSVIGDGAVGNEIRFNSILQNAELAIDLGGDGRTDNDAGDADTGANNLQNFPVITSVLTSTGVVSGTLNSTPNTGFLIDFYRGEDFLFLGTSTTSTNSGGDASFNATFSGLDDGDVIIATATHQSLDNTSEVSDPFVVGTPSSDPPDLVAEITSINLGSVPADTVSLVPGERLTTQLLIRNESAGPASGKITVVFNIINQDTLQSFFVAHFNNQTIALDGDDEKTFKYTLILPSGAPTGEYALTAQIDAGNAITETDEDNNTASSDQLLNIELAFGGLGGRGNVVLTVPDTDGTLAIFKLVGGGSAQVIAGEGFFDLVLTDTTVKSNITITTKNSGLANDDGKIVLRNVTFGAVGLAPLGLAAESRGGIGIAAEGDSPIGKLIAKTARLIGTLDAPAGLSALTLDQADSGAIINIGVPPDVEKPSATLVFNLVRNVSINSQIPIKSLTATEWLDDDQAADAITAPTMGKLTIKGNKKFALAGDFEADLTLAGANGVAQTFAGAKIAGKLENAAWDITGDSAAIVAGASNNWSLTLHSNLKALTLGDVANAAINVDGAIGALKLVRIDDQSSVTADTIKSIAATGDKKNAIPGDWAADLNLNNADAAVTTLGSAKIAGTLGAATWDVPLTSGAISAATVAGWTATLGNSKSIAVTGNATGAVTANTLGAFTVKGNVTDFVLRLLQPTVLDNPKLLAIKTVTIGGTATDFTLRSAGHVGSFTAGRLVDSIFFVGVDDAVVALPTTINQLDDITATLGSFTLKGISGSAEPTMVDSAVAAGVITKASARTVTTVPEGTEFGFAADTITSLVVTVDGVPQTIKLPVAPVVTNNFVVRPL